jgi:dTDP-4-dehydrorhamnose reductase
MPKRKDGPMRVLVTGARGQLGWELARAFQPIADVVAVDRSAMDLGDETSVRRVVREVAPDVVLNAAAYTAVDRAEDEQALAMRVNGDAPGWMADECRRLDALLVHYSTDYVWDGSGDAPRDERDPTSPCNAYGRSKLAGERAVAEAGGRWLTFRTSWVFADRGGNFPRTMLRLAAERERLSVVGDQHGAPTSARLLADATAHAVRGAVAETADGRFRPGVYNVVAGGSTTWHGVAVAVVEGARERGLPVRAVEVDAIPSSAWPTRARRPANSRMSTSAFSERFGLALPHWRRGIDLFLDAVAEAAPARAPAAGPRAAATA